ncbi:hypothetical protein J2T09_000703 [Neorhizobium huautlense]|uniref:Uncharacterized protein n=1 Tax=Neorhizobium huautlense TaxID=67774 RepID=A0ABT9PNC1_9HYPH|nr:hypothetical protein [Neorhizobium huautlense]MDP9835961.1 hypothetical protein [Neorhizobium huautlense]
MLPGFFVSSGHDGVACVLTGGFMHQLICFSILLVVAVLFNAVAAAKMASDGNWGEAVGQLFFGPLVFFYVTHSVIYFATRLIRGPAAVASYSASRLNYIAFVITLLGILGAAAQRATPPV